MPTDIVGFFTYKFKKEYYDSFYHIIDMVLVYLMYKKPQKTKVLLINN